MAAYFTHVDPRVPVERLRRSRVVQIGAGSVGSQITLELARSRVGEILVIDGDVIEETNLSRFAPLPARYVGWKKATALSDWIMNDLKIPDAVIVPFPYYVTDHVTDDQLDEVLDSGDLLIVATDDRRVQRRVGERVLALDTVALFPGLYQNGGGEVFASYGRGSACLLCWEAFRDEDVRLRGVHALGAEIAEPIALAIQLALGLLDPQASGDFAELLRGASGERRPQNLFVIPSRFAGLQYDHVRRRRNCPSCSVEPSTRRRYAPPSEPASSLVPSRDQAGAPMAAGAWNRIASLTPVDAVSYALLGALCLGLATMVGIILVQVVVAIWAHLFIAILLVGIFVALKVALLGS